LPENKEAESKINTKLKNQTDRSQCQK